MGYLNDIHEKTGGGTKRAGMTNWSTRTIEKNESSCRGCRNDSQGRAGERGDREDRRTSQISLRMDVKEGKLFTSCLL